MLSPPDPIPKASSVVPYSLPSPAPHATNTGRLYLAVSPYTRVGATTVVGIVVVNSLAPNSETSFGVVAALDKLLATGQSPSAIPMA